jgi:hypothetical protein
MMQQEEADPSRGRTGKPADGFLHPQNENTINYFRGN